VHAHIVKLGDIIESYLTVLVHIEFVVGGLDTDETSLAQFTTEYADELVEADGTTAISVKFAQNALCLCFV